MLHTHDRAVGRRDLLRIGLAGSAALLLPTWGCESAEGLATPQIEAVALGFTSFDAREHRFVIAPADRTVLWYAPGERPLTLDPGGRGFNYPVAAATDPSGRAYVLDRGDARVVVFDAGGRVLAELGGPGDVSFADAMSYPADLVVDDRGNVYVADPMTGRVQAFPGEGGLEGAEVRLLGDGGLAAPRSLAIDPEGNLYVLDIGRREIVVFDRGGLEAYRFAAVDAWGERLALPRHLVVDRQGIAYVADPSRTTVEAIDARTGAHLDALALSGEALAVGPAWAPHHLGLGPDSRLYVAVTPVEVTG